MTNRQRKTMVQPIHLPALQVVANKPWILLWSFAAIMLLELYSLFPGPQYQVEEKRFWFDDTMISFQAWVDYAGTRAAFCVLIHLLKESNPQYKHEFNVLFWLMFGYLLDYFVIYNNPIARIEVLSIKIPISYTLFMLFLASVNVWKAFKKAWT